MLALISDIHSNLEALNAVLADISSQGETRIFCLGDVVGYGPDPEACLTLVRERVAVCLKGNHDVAVLAEPLGFNQIARDAAIWAREQLKPGWLASGVKRKNWRFLGSLPERYDEERFVFVHASPRDPVMEYVMANDTVDTDFVPGEKVYDILHSFEGTCFIGHTHQPGVIGPDGVFHAPDELEDGWDLSQEPAIVNIGSVGQPRDGDPRACYVLIRDGKAVYRRVTYDMHATAEKIRAIPELHDLLAERLLQGR